MQKQKDERIENGHYLITAPIVQKEGEDGQVHWYLQRSITDYQVRFSAETVSPEELEQRFPINEEDILALPDIATFEVEFVGAEEVFIYKIT